MTRLTEEDLLKGWKDLNHRFPTPPNFGSGASVALKEERGQPVSSARNERILELFKQGLTRKQIADRMDLTVGAVDGVIYRYNKTEQFFGSRFIIAKPTELILRENYLKIKKNSRFTELSEQEFVIAEILLTKSNFYTTAGFIAESYFKGNPPKTAQTDIRNIITLLRESVMEIDLYVKSFSKLGYCFAFQK